MGKNKYIILLVICCFLTLILFVSMFNNRTNEILKQHTSNEQLNSINSDESRIENLFKVIDNDSLLLSDRIAVLNQFVDENVESNFGLLKKIYLHIKDLYVQQWIEESQFIHDSQNLTDNLYLFYRICEIVGESGSDESIMFLTEETEPEKWDQYFQSSNKKNLSAAQITDDFFRLYVFKALLISAVKKPEIFDQIENYTIEYLRGNEGNVKNWFIDYKEKYFQLNPSKIPKEGYIKFPGLSRQDPDYYNVFFLNLRIDGFVQKHKKLPSTLLDLTIPKGGDYVYIPVDPNMEVDNNFYTYRIFREGNRWMYVLSSVGPNKKIGYPIGSLESWNGKYFPWNAECFTRRHRSG